MCLCVCVCVCVRRSMSEPMGENLPAEFEFVVADAEMTAGPGTEAETDMATTMAPEDGMDMASVGGTTAGPGSVAVANEAAESALALPVPSSTAVGGTTADSDITVLRHGGGADARLVPVMVTQVPFIGNGNVLVSVPADALVDDVKRRVEAALRERGHNLPRKDFGFLSHRATPYNMPVSALRRDESLRHVF